MSYVDLRPDRIRQVEVLVDGAWHAGVLEAYRRDCDLVWSGCVRWSDGPGRPSHLEWYLASAVRTVVRRAPPAGPR